MTTGSNERKAGKVKWFNTAKGYGFIEADDEPGVDLFVHYRSIQVEGFKNLTEGQRCTFLQVKGDKGMAAVEVEPERMADNHGNT